MLASYSGDDDDDDGNVDGKYTCEYLIMQTMMVNMYKLATTLWTEPFACPCREKHNIT